MNMNVILFSVFRFTWNETKKCYAKAHDKILTLAGNR